MEAASSSSEEPPRRSRAAARPKPVIVIARDNPGSSLPRRKLHILAETIVRGEKRGGTLSLVYSNDRRIRSLNRRYRQIDKTTDVLSFPMENMAMVATTAGGLIGEVYVNVPLAKRRSQDDGHSLYDHLALLTCHGILHLLGYDHGSSTEAESMRRRECRYLDTPGLIDLVEQSGGGRNAA